jgi:hypothetical protein
MQVIKLVYIQMLRIKYDKNYRGTKIFETRKPSEEFDATLKLYDEVMVGMTNHVLKSNFLSVIIKV